MAMRPMERIHQKEFRWNVPVKYQEMEIRFAQKKDLPQIIALCKEHAEYEKSKYDPENKLDVLSNSIFGQNPVLNCLVVENDDIIIGYATFTKQFST